MNLIKNKLANLAGRKLISPNVSYRRHNIKGGCVMRRCLILFLGVALFFSTGVAFAEPNNGAKEIVIPSGNQGDVKFPHHQHQQTLTDCMTCHELFPQQAGAISDLKQKGTLAQKQVMNKLCVKCHKAKKEAGDKSGPIACSQCHVK
jgi:hypothetical protein